MEKEIAGTSGPTNAAPEQYEPSPPVGCIGQDKTRSYTML